MSESWFTTSVDTSTHELTTEDLERAMAHLQDHAGDVPIYIVSEAEREFFDLCRYRAFDILNGARACRVCGCTEGTACSPPCHWVSPNLCSACA